MLKKAWKIQFTLAISLLILGGFAYWLEVRYKPQEEAAEEESKKIFHWKAFAIESLTIQDRGTTLMLRCMGFPNQPCQVENLAASHWELVQPIHWKADDANVNSLVTTLSHLTANEVMTLREEETKKKQTLLKEYGLSRAEVGTLPQITLRTVNRVFRLFLGHEHPIGGTLFGMLESFEKESDSVSQAAAEDLVFLIPQYFKNQLHLESVYWRNKKLITLAPHEIASLQLKNQVGEVVARRQEGRWLLDQHGSQTYGSTEDLDRLLQSVVSLSAKEFALESHREPRAQALLKASKKTAVLVLHPEATIPDSQHVHDSQCSHVPRADVVLTVFQQNPPKAKKLKSSVPPRIYATVSGLDPLFELDAAAGGLLQQRVSDLRFAHLITTMDQFAVKTFEFEAAFLGAQPLVFTQVDQKWTVAPVSESVFEADLKNSLLSQTLNEKMPALLEALAKRRIREFLTVKPAHLEGAQTLIVTLKDEKSTVLGKFHFTEQQGNLFATDLLHPSAEVFAVEIGLKKFLPWGMDFFKTVVETAPTQKATPP